MGNEKFSFSNVAEKLSQLKNHQLTYYQQQTMASFLPKQVCQTVSQLASQLSKPGLQTSQLNYVWEVMIMMRWIKTQSWWNCKHMMVKKRCRTFFDKAFTPFESLLGNVLKVNIRQPWPTESKSSLQHVFSSSWFSKCADLSWLWAGYVYAYNLSKKWEEDF